MIAKVLSATVIGLNAELIEVETDVSNGLPATIIVGLPDTAVQEARERVMISPAEWRAGVSVQFFPEVKRPWSL